MVSGLVNVFLAGEPVAAGGTDGGHLHAVTRKMEIAEEIPPTAVAQRLLLRGRWKSRRRSHRRLFRSAAGPTHV